MPLTNSTHYTHLIGEFTHPPSSMRRVLCRAGTFTIARPNSGPLWLAVYLIFTKFVLRYNSVISRRSCDESRGIQLSK